MGTHSSGCWLALAVAVLLLVGCGKSAQEVEAERAKANAEWMAEVERAEHAREREEKKLVEAELARHRQRERSDDERAGLTEGAERQAEQDRRLLLVREKLQNPESALFSNVHWNADGTALCGTVSVRNEHGVFSAGMAFIVGDDDDAAIDSTAADEHERFSAVARTIDCSP